MASFYPVILASFLTGDGKMHIFLNAKTRLRGGNETRHDKKASI